MGRQGPVFHGGVSCPGRRRARRPSPRPLGVATGVGRRAVVDGTAGAALAQRPAAPGESDQEIPSCAAKTAAMIAYPAAFAWLFGPSGGGAQTHVHWQIRATLRGTVPTPGSGTWVAKSSDEKAAATSATLAPAAR